jgi:hypothetical protein
MKKKPKLTQLEITTAESLPHDPVITMPKQYTKESLKTWTEKTKSLSDAWWNYWNYQGQPDRDKIQDWWLEKLSSLKQELLLEVGEDEAEYEHEDFIINEERARVRAIINKKL